MCCQVSFAGMCACTAQAWAWVTHGGIGKLRPGSEPGCEVISQLFYPLPLHGSHEN